MSQEQKGPPRSQRRSSLISLILFGVWLAAMVLLYRPGQSDQQDKSVDLTQLISEIRAGQVQKISVDGDNLHITRTDGVEQVARKEPFVAAPILLKEMGVEPDALSKVSFEVAGPSAWGNWVSLITSLFPMVLFIGFLWWMNRRSQGGMGQVTSFGKSRAKPVVDATPQVTFADVAGVDEAKLELQEVVEFLKNPQQFQEVGARIPKGVLLVGPPGTGKTLLARAVAGEAGVVFFHISGSEFVEMFVGVGAARVRDLFEQAKRSAPCIVFVDEIDAVGRHRGAGMGGGNDEREQTLNQILVELDGFEPNAGIVVIAATNRPDVLDPALLRPGRFDRQVVVDIPDLVGRIQILNVHARGKPLGPDVELQTIAKQTPGFSGADLANLLNEGALMAARRKSHQISMSDLEGASERVTLGPERRSRVLSPREKAVTAYHEAGHALAARMVPNSDPVHKITIVGHGRAGGFTQILPEEERHLWSKSQFLDSLVWILAGQAAEELVFGEATTGATNDLERATGIARDMVTRYGMSDVVGPLALGRRESMVFLGRDLGERQEYSEDTARQVDQEVRRIVDDAKGRACSILSESRPALERVAQALIERETLDGAAFESLVGEPAQAAEAAQLTPLAAASELSAVSTLQTEPTSADSTV
jgi:cell division protease FtsH